MKIQKNIDETVIYQTKSGAITLKQDVSSNMLWASQNQIADIFEVKRPAVTKHIRNILKDKELDSNSVRSKMEHTAEDGKTYKEDNIVETPKNISIFSTNAKLTITRKGVSRIYNTGNAAHWVADFAEDLRKGVFS